MEGRKKRSGEVTAARSKKRRVVVADAPTAARYDELKWSLIERQREILSEVQGKIRDVRSEHSEKAPWRPFGRNSASLT